MTSPPERLKTVTSECDRDSETLEPIVSNRNTYLAAFSALLYVFAMGMTIGYSAQATVDMKRPGSRFRKITTDDITWIGSLTNLGGAPANIVGGYFTHKFGRKAVLMLTSPLFLSSWLMITYASSVEWLFVGRIVSGFCTGLYVIAVPSYLSEISPQEIRGLVSSGFPLANNLGILAVMSLGIVLRWSWLAITIAFVIACSACFMVFMPESPDWLVPESRIGEAVKGLKFLRGKHSDAKKEVQDIIQRHSHQEDKGINFRDLRNPALYKPIAISIAFMFFHQTSGIGPLLAYTVEIFQNAGSAIAPTTAAAIFGVVQVLANLFCGSIVDRYGRRKLYIISGICTTVTLVILGAHSLIIKEHPNDLHLLGYVPIIFIIVYTFVLTFGLGSVPFVMIPELTPMRFRSTVLSLAFVFLSLFNFLFTKTYNYLRTALGDYGLYWTYGFFTFLSVFYGYFIVPETKNLSVEEINKSFSRCHSKK